MFTYAQLNESDTVIGISQLSGEVSVPNMVLLDGSRENDDIVKLGWRLVDGKWHEPLPVEEVLPPPEPSNSEIAKLMTDIYAQLYIAGVI